MFYNYRANTLTALLELFLQNHSASESENPFQRDWIVVQNREMQQWLSLNQAEQKGISANNEFIFPSELMWKIYRLIRPEIPKQFPSDRIAMQLSLFDLFEEGKPGSIPFELDSQKTRFEFARQIADVFDLYQVYRPEMLNVWAEGKLKTGDYSERWQANVWRKLNSFWAKHHPEIPNRAEAFEELTSKLAKEDTQIKNLPASITIFGLSHYSAPFVQLVSSLAGVIDIHFYDLTFTGENGNRTVIEKRWNKSKKEVQVLLQQTLNKENNNHKESELFLDLDRAIDKQEVKIHSCHSVKREVEILKDEILTALDKDASLKLNDILILVPEMESYGPLIKTTFGIHEGIVQVPVTIPHALEDPLKVCFLELILLFENNEIKASSFLDFLQLQVIQNAYNFTEEDLYAIKNWFIENNIHWGLGTEKGRYTIEKAVLNLFSGFMMEDEVFRTVKDIIPFKNISTSEQIELVAKLSEVLDKLKFIQKEVNESKTVSDWLLNSKNWITQIVGNSAELSSVYLSLDKLIESARYAKTKTKISFSQFSLWLNEQILDSEAASAGLGRGIVLSTYIPYRSIPFKFVAILGLNEGVFPRNPARPKFDLIHAFPEPGDRIVKDDDAMLFLELLNSAEDFLHLSYIGQDQQNEAEKLPSVFIQQLIDQFPYLKNSGEHFINHKLHGFDPYYYSKPYSYSVKQRDVSKRVHSSNVRNEVFLPHNLALGDSKADTIITVQDIISFFVYPCKYFLSNMLKVHNAYYENELGDREVFKLTGLEKYKLDQLLLDGSLKDVPVGQLQDYAESAGLLPLGIAGKKELSQEWELISELKKASSGFINTEVDIQEISLNIGESRIAGLIGNIYGKNRVVWRVGKARAVDLIDLWVNHLLLSAGNTSVERSILVSKEGSANIRISSLETVQEFGSILEDLLKWYSIAGKEKASLNFFPESSKEFAVASSKDKPGLEAIEQALKKWVGSDYVAGEGAKYYNELVWRGEEPLIAGDFTKNALLFWSPLLEALEGSGH